MSERHRRARAAENDVRSHSAAGRDLIAARQPTAPLPRNSTWRLLLAAAAYWAIVFLCGFALGAMRVFLIVPRIGATAAVLLEAPLMLGASWFVSAWCMERFGISKAAGPRIVLGMTAFGLMLAAELGLSLTIFHRSLSEHLSAYATIAGVSGLVAQFAFGLLPYFQARPLAGVRAVHTAIYAVMTAATCYILYAVVAGSQGRPVWIALALLGVESFVFIGNGLKCPLTAVAVRYGAGRGPLFDSFLPERITRHTLEVFVPLILLGVGLLAVRWLTFGECSRWIWLC